MGPDAGETLLPPETEDDAENVAVEANGASSAVCPTPPPAEGLNHHTVGRTPAAKYKPLPRGYWIASFFLALILLLYGGILLHSMLQLDNNRMPAITFSPSGEKQKPANIGAFAVFYRGANFEVPFRTAVMKMDFSYRTDVEWAEDFPPSPSSARIAARVVIKEPGSYRLFIDANDGARIWINNQLVFDKWQTESIGEPAAIIDLPAGPVPLYAEWTNSKANGWLGIQLERDGKPRRFLSASELIPDPFFMRPAP